MEIIFPDQETTPFRQWCLVYDTRDGRVIHIHEFIALDIDNAASTEELERQALSHVVRREDPSYLRVLHPPAEMLPDPTVVYRVNLRDGALQVLPRFPIPEGKPSRLPVDRRRAIMPDEE